MFRQTFDQWQIWYDNLLPEDFEPKPQPPWEEENIDPDDDYEYFEKIEAAPTASKNHKDLYEKQKY